MLHLVKSELLRFRGTALGLAALHLVILTLVATFDVLYPTPVQLALGALAYGLLGACLGFVQIGHYRARRQWTFLLHRPLAPPRIYLALAGAALLVLTVVIAVPLLLTSLSLEVVASRAVDLRHHLAAFFALGHALCFCLLGHLLALGTRIGAALLLALPLFYLSPGIHIDYPFGVLVAVAVVLLAIVVPTFRPAAGSLSRHSAAVFVTGLAVQPALFALLLVAGNAAFSVAIAVREEGWRSFAEHGWDDHFADGTLARAAYLNGGDLLAHGLRLDPASDTRQLLAELDRDAATQRAPTWWKLPRRQQAPQLDEGTTLGDPDRGVLWTFRHDQMLFQGHNTRYHETVGWLGREGFTTHLDDARPFAEVPRVLGEARQVVTACQVDAFLPRSRSFQTLVELPEGDRLVSPLADHGTYATVLSERALHILPGGSWPGLEVAWPEPVWDLVRVAVVEHGDGFVVSLLFGARGERELGPARQVTGRLEADGTFKVVVDKALLQGPPAAWRHWGFLQAPLTQTALDAVAPVVGPMPRMRAAPGDQLRRLPPLAIQITALLLTVGAAVLAFLGARQRGFPRTETLAWTALAVVAGLPGLLAFVLLAPSSSFSSSPTSPSTFSPSTFSPRTFSPRT